MVYYFFEDVPQEFKLPEDSVAVALNIVASYKLELKGINYLKLQDHYNHREICDDVEEYLKSQLNWLNKFNSFIQDIFPAAKKYNINLPLLYFYNIKVLIDQVVYTTRTFYRFFENEKTTKVIYYSQILHNEKIDRWLWFYFGETIESRLIAPICKKIGIHCTKIELKKTNLVDYRNKISKLKSKFSFFVSKSNWDRLREYKKLWLSELPTLFVNPFNRKAHAGNILILNGRDYVYDFCKDATRYGFNILFKGEKCIRKQSYLFPWGEKITLNDNNIDMIPISRLSKDDIMGIFINKYNLFQWINEQCKCDVSELLITRFEFLIIDVFKETLSLIRENLNIYSQYNIDYVLTYSLSSIDDFAGISSCRVNNKPKSIGFYHGVDAFKSMSRYFFEFYHFDLYYVSTKYEVEQIKYLKKYFSESVPNVFEYSYLRNRFYKLNKSRNISTKNIITKKKELVLFVPIMRALRQNKSIDYTLLNTMYFSEWHKLLIDYFSKRNDKIFIWKAYLQQPFNFDTIPNIIQNKNCSNIVFSTKTLIHWLSKADRVLCDVPSSAFFEAIFSGIPVFSTINSKELTVDQSFYENLGVSLKEYSNFEEGINHVDEYLDSNSSHYIVDMQKTENIILEYL